MLWYLLLCFATPDGTECRGVETPDQNACEQLAYYVRSYAEAHELKVEVSCITAKQYT